MEAALLERRFILGRSTPERQAREGNVHRSLTAYMVKQSPPAALTLVQILLACSKEFAGTRTR